jgi:hypothetical protein
MSRRGGGSFLVVSDPRHHLFGMPILTQLASDAVLDTAYEWLWRRDSIDHLLLLDQLAVHIKDRRVLNLIGQYLRRTSERGGSFWDYEKGISLGCPLSPLIGGFFLNALDAAAAKLRLFYVRFMDDILILAPTRWQLRGAVKVVNRMLGALGLEKAPRQDFHRQDRTRLRLMVRRD